MQFLVLENKNPRKVRKIAGASHGGKGEKASMQANYNYTWKLKKENKNIRSSPSRFLFSQEILQPKKSIVEPSVEGFPIHLQEQGFH